ncbi:MAG: hypothetical protein KF819_00350 [Labilithrix sp.]|nr:hypothetical protein [Labilithrix sp.]
MISTPARLSFAVALAVGLGLVASCSSSSVEPPAGPDAEAPEEDAGDDPSFPCPASGVSKGPWTLAMTRTSVIVRWEACREGSSPTLSFKPEAGGASVEITSTQKTVTLTQRHTAPLGPLRSPDDLPGTFVMHDAAIGALTPGTCYRYELAADRTLAGRFCTAQPDGGRVHFLAIGDTNPLLGEATAKVLGHVLPLGADFVVHGGDIQYYDSFLETWAGWFPPMQPLLALGAFQPALGNHELETDDELTDYTLRFFGTPNLGGASMYYRFESGGLWFHVLDTEQPIDPGSPQGQWLLAGLSDVSQQPGFRGSIIAMHRPFVTCGDNAQKDTERKAFASAFAQHKVVFVIQAHIHGYERFEIDGLTFVTTGGGGGLIGNIDENLSRAECAMRRASGGFFHALDVVVEGKELRAKAVDDSGAARDSFTIALP